MKKILFFIESLAGGGAEKVLTTLVKNINKQEFDVTVLSVVNTGIYVDEIKQHCHYQYMLDDSANLNPLQRIKYRIDYKFIYNQPPEIVYRKYINDEYDIEVAFIEGFATKFIAASSNSRSKKIAWVHTDMRANNYASYCFTSKVTHIAAYKNYDRINCVSNNVAEVFRGMFFDDNRVVVQYNPVDSDEVVAKGFESIDLLPNPHLQLGTIGRLEQQKGFLRLVEILGKLYKEGHDFSLWIVGEGSQRPQLKSLIDQYQLNDCIKLVGFQSNPYKYMSKCDAFVCSSYAEGFSTAATEALILGKPIFTTECAGMRELFGDESCGEIVPNTDDALYEMLKNLVSGKLNPVDYLPAVKRRIPFFDIKQRISEIETLLD